MLFVGIYTFLIATGNAHYLNKHDIKHPATDGEKVSVIIPARNEEKNIGALLEGLVHQSYKNYEILVIDDNSTDRTFDIISEYAKRYDFISIYKGEPKKDAKLNGKIYALSQLMPHTSGEFIYATDADTIHDEDSIAYMASELRENKLDAVSGFPEERCETYWGTICIAAMNFALVFYIPLPLVYRHPMKFFTLANGQTLAFRKKAMEDIGGYESIANQLCDDVLLCKRFVEKKKRYALLRTANHVYSNMYSTTEEAFRGISRSVSGIFPAKVWVIAPILIIVMILVGFCISPIAIILLLCFGYAKAAGITAIGAALLSIGYYRIARLQRFPIRIALAWPCTLIATCSMYLWSYFVRKRGKKFVWKDRAV